jgi:nucleoside-diphosphate-sugar epimerase
VDDPKVRRPDITLAKTLLGWEPRVSFEEGITKTIEFFRGRVAAGDPVA